MPTILLWENPAETWMRGAKRCVVTRSAPFSAEQSAPPAIVDNDVTWGTFAVPAAISDGVEYSISYVDSIGVILTQIPDTQITKVSLSPNLCRITGFFVKPDASAWAQRNLSISNDLPGMTGSFQRSFAANSEGKISFYLPQAIRIRLELEGDSQAYDISVPKLQALTLDELLTYGTSMRADNRGRP